MKKNKHITIAVSLLMGLVLLSSCEDILETEPVSELSPDDFWQSNLDAEQGVAGIYDAMQRTYRLKKFLWGEFRADNFVVSNRSNANTEDLIRNNITPQSDRESLQWDELYSMIFRANLAIERIPQIPQFNTQLLGEAYAARAYAYFDCYRVWGGVPLFTKAEITFSDDSFKERSTAQQVLDQVLLDIQEAEKNLTTINSRHQFSKTSLMAFKAQVFMHRKQYQEANDIIDELINTGLFSLTTTREEWRNLFLNDDSNFPGEGEEGPELIMSLRYEFEEDGNRASGVYTLFFPGVPSYFVSKDFENQWIERFPTDANTWEAKYPGVPPHVIEDEDADPDDITFIYGDYRYYETITERGNSGDDLRISKYHKRNFSPQRDDTDIILFRYADMLLLKAEALNQLDRPSEAVEIVDQIRTARELPTVNSGTTPDIININDKDELENFILDERKFELIGEGTRWWDLIRTDKAVEILGPINGQTEETLIWPIWATHIINNPKLEQNEAYK